MKDPHACTFVLGTCDAEGEAIRHLLNAYGRENRNGERRPLRLFPKEQTPLPPVVRYRDLQGFHRTVVLIRCTDPGLEEMIGATGRRVVTIDDKARMSADGELVDRRNACTVLEQVEALLGYAWQDPRRDAIIANARGGIPALAEVLWRKAHPGSDPPEREPRVDWWPELEKPVEAPGPKNLPLGRDPLWAQRHEQIVADARAIRDAFHKSMLQALKGLASPPPWLDHVPNLEAAVEALRNQSHGVRCRVLSTGRNAVREGDPELILVAAPERFRPVLEDAIYRWMWEHHGEPLKTRSPLTRRLEILALYQEDDGTEPPAADALLVRVEFSAGAARRPLVDALLRPAMRRDLGLGRLATEVSGIDAVRCVFTGTLGSGSRALSRLVDHLLDELLTGNRPLRAWRTSFLQPLRFKDADAFRTLRSKLIDGDDALPFAPLAAEQEERAYFLLQLRKHLVPDSKRNGIPHDEDRRDATLLSFEWKPGDLELHLTRVDYDRPVEHPIRSVRLHLFAANCMVVEWTLAWETDAKADGDEERRHDKSEEQKCLWRFYFDRLPGDAPSLASVLDLNRHARFVYSSFAAEEVHGDDRLKKRTLIRLNCGNDTPAAMNHAAGISARQPFGPCFRALLQKSLGEDLKPEDTLDLLGDDRARVLCSVVVWGGQPIGTVESEAFRRIRARLHMVEDYDGGWPYDPGFSAKELEGGSYDRFAASGTWYGISSHSFVCLTFGAFGRKVVHETHMAGIYRRMFVLTLLHGAALQAFALDIPGSLEAWTPGERLSDSYRRLRPAFLRFTNLLWFRQVSSQVQGVELFDRMQEQAGLEREYQRIREEIADTDSYWQEESEIRREQRMRALTILGIPFAVMLALYGLREKPDGAEPAHTWWEWLRCALGMSDEGAAALVAVLVAVAGVIAVFGVEDRNIRSRLTHTTVPDRWKSPLLYVVVRIVVFLLVLAVLLFCAIMLGVAGASLAVGVSAGLVGLIGALGYMYVSVVRPASRAPRDGSLGGGPSATDPAPERTPSSVESLTD